MIISQPDTELSCSNFNRNSLENQKMTEKQIFRPNLKQKEENKIVSEKEDVDTE